ncbi:hypothetical protein PROFUN_17157, partial [Planoprotostelium fungivorum]
SFGALYGRFLRTLKTESVTTSSLLLTLIVHSYLLIGPNWLVLNRLVTDPCHHIIIPLIESPITLAEADPFCQG